VRTSTAFLRVIGKLQSGVSAKRARGNLDAVAAQLRRDYPQANDAMVGIAAIPLLEDMTTGSRSMLLTLLGAVGFVLLISCANIASLWISRAARRRREAAIRTALGATQGRLARQALLQGLLLAGCGGALGALLAVWGVPLLLWLSPAQMPRAREVHIDASALAAACGLALFCGFLLGALTAFSTRPGELNERAGTGRGGRLRAALVVIEVGLSLLLLTGAGLAARSFQRVAALDPGFRTEGLLTFRLSLPATRYRTPDDVARFRDRLYERIAAIPGVSAAGAVSILPLSGPLGTADFTIAGRAAPPPNERPTADYRMTDPTYFQAMRIPILRGRGFTEQDNAQHGGVAVISDEAVKLYWKGRDPVGSHILLQDNSKAPRDVEVVGVSGSVRENGIDKPPSVCIFVPIPQIPPVLARFLTNNFFWAIRTRPGIDVARQVRAEIQAVDSDVAAADSPMERYVEAALAARRFSLRILAAFALAAVLLAGGGLYALISYGMAARTREIGIRVAMGARPRQIGAMALRQGAVLSAVGVAIGTACSWVLSRYAD